MRSYSWETAEEIGLAAAQNMKRLRKRLGISQKELSIRSGVSYASIKRFEETGAVSFLSLIKIAVSMNAENGVKALFTDVAYKSIEEVINEQK